ncbi:MAG: hypothetical protein JW958_13540 [Candidatus Eisenbacteria bacterium]|nr:hypothetical protein [Candidatus Eisenbacteria bacterium]
MTDRKKMGARISLFLCAAAMWVESPPVGAGEGALYLDAAGMEEGVFAGDTVSVGVEVSALRAAGVPESWLRAEWTGGAGGGFTVRPVPPLSHGEKARIDWRTTIPLVESGAETLHVWLVASGSGETLARADAPIGPTVPGERFRVEAGGEPLHVSLCGELLLVESEAGVEPWDLGEPAPMEHVVGDGGEAVAGNGFFLCVRGDLIFRVDAADGARRRLSDPAFRAFRPTIGPGVLLWARHCCGLPGEIVAADREGRPLFGTPLESPLAGGIACDERIAVWVEEGVAGRTLRVADPSTGSVRSVGAPGDPWPTAAVSDGSVVCAVREDTGAGLYLIDPEGGGGERIASGRSFSAGPWCSGERIAWAERDGEGESVFLREKAGTRTLRIASSTAGIEAAALSGSVFVWVDGEDRSAVRGIRIRWPGERFIPPRDAASLGFRFVGAWASVEKVRISWSFREDPGKGVFTVWRARETADSTIDSTAVGFGELGGTGPYLIEDRSIPAPGAPERVRYWLLLERGEIVETLGPLAVSLPDRPAAVDLLPDGPNPARGAVRFVLTVPRGESAGALSVRVFDARGRLVSESVMERAGSGRFPIIWDGKDRSGRRAPPGVYFLRMEREGRVFPARKIVLL